MLPPPPFPREGCFNIHPFYGQRQQSLINLFADLLFAISSQGDLIKTWKFEPFPPNSLEVVMEQTNIKTNKQTNKQKKIQTTNIK